MFEFINEAKNIAIVGLSPDENKDSNMVASYLQKQDFKIYPIYPKMDEILGEKVYRSLNEIQDNIDIVVMFRKAEFAETLVDEVIQKGAKTLWLQLDIINDKAKEKALQNNINFVQNRCIKIEYMRLKDGFAE
ncbi:CoA-binding protein [Campylobacter pinnipediorum]|uniref:CoA-binding protein n=1 Tax=Campylobacter pinnipediorum subsp. pinnipediorum TaxID=1660067 RepID=A0AAX0L8Y2_9BACT|nr:CoA-binding protein [Campylobacter pinnipediorum]AQW82220.1 CoA-binding domain protein [Campylobacter pinnipediorum subsp. pinnipediorum]OPA75030.1 CoA-binding protein [Campylobacter pinnipediorum subsp. pinnipediorum]